MRANHRQNGTRVTAILGSLVAVLTVVLLVVVSPVSTFRIPSSISSGADPLSISAARTAAPQPALHTITSSAGGFSVRHVEPGSGVSVFRTPQDCSLRFVTASATGHIAPEGSRLPLRIILCTWLN